MPPPHSLRPAWWRRAPAGLMAGAGALALLVWTSRRAAMGAPVMDDYHYLHALRFQPPDLFGAMGLNTYWRPVSRQLYYGLLGRTIIDHPWVAVAAHLVLFAVLGVLLYRVARTWLAPGPAAVVATFPLLAEPARLMLIWPSGAQPLIAMTLATLALHEALRGRRWTAALAALAAALSYEQSLLVFAPVALLASRGRAPGESRRASLLPVLAALAVLALGEWIARGHGAGLLVPTGLEVGRLAPGPHLDMSVQAQLGLWELSAPARGALGVAYALLGACAVALGARRAARERLGRVSPVVLVGLAWFVAGVVLASAAGEGLRTWRSMLPALGLGLALGTGLAAISVWLPAGLAALRVAGLLLAPVVPHGVEGRLPETTVRESFLHIARLQRVVDSARRRLREPRRTFAPGAAIRYWSLPQMTGEGFGGPRALQIWTDDPNATWSWLDDLESRHDAVLAFNTGAASPAVLLEPAALETYRLAVVAHGAGDLIREDSLIGAAMAQQQGADAFTDELARVASRLARQRGDLGRADSLNHLSWTLGGETPDFFAMVAMLALERGQLEPARAAAGRCLALSPRHPEALEVFRSLAARGDERGGP